MEKQLQMHVPLYLRNVWYPDRPPLTSSPPYQGLVQPDPEAAAFWTQFLMGLDGIFLVVGVWAFEPIVSGD